MAENDYLGNIQNQRLNQQWSESMSWSTPSWMKGRLKQGPTVSQTRFRAPSAGVSQDWNKGNTNIMTPGMNDGNSTKLSQRSWGLSMPSNKGTSGLPSPTGLPAPTGNPVATNLGSPLSTPTSPNAPITTASTSRAQRRSPWGTPSGTTI